MSNKEVKEDIISSLRNREEYFKQVNEVEYRTRCPFCGDSENLNTGHLYIRINPNDNFPIVYNCFKCDEKGILTTDMLNMMDISDISIKSGLFTLNKTSDKVDKKNLVTETKMIYFDYQLPEIKRGKKISYIENRLGLSFNDDDLKDMKIITSLKDFLILNKIKNITLPQYIVSRLEDHFVGFLTYGNSHILFRDITEKDEFRWIKYPITPESKENRIFYSVAGSVDVLSNKPLTINLGEGVLDILSACYNLGYNEINSLNVAVSGKFFDRILLYLVDLGLVGSNITVNIFADNDDRFNKKKGNGSTSLAYYRKILHKHKYLYKQINIYYNTIGKDIGVPRSEISLKKYRL